jgi:hypothetical protein
MQLMADASTPPLTLPDKYHAVAGYVGGDTPHVWTVDEWARFAHLRKLPIWTRSNPRQADPYRDAVVLCYRLLELGVPPQCPVALDKETASDPVYLLHFGQGLYVAGRKLLAQYESLSAFNKRQTAGPEKSEFWVADWTGRAHMFAKPVYSVQYANSQMSHEPWDVSVVRWNLYKRMWR